MKRGIFRSSQYFHAFSRPTDTPSLAEQTMMAASAARRASITSPAKSNAPGVSSTLIRHPLYSSGATAVEMEICRLVSSGS